MRKRFCPTCQTFWEVCEDGGDCLNREPHCANCGPDFPHVTLNWEPAVDAGKMEVVEMPAAPKLPTDAQARKNAPVYSGFLAYFPLAVAYVAEVSRKGNEQHNPGQPLHWDRSKSGDELDADARHLIEAGTFDVDGVRHSGKHAWRAMANLQKELEAAQAAGQPFFNDNTGDQNK